MHERRRSCERLDRATDLVFRQTRETKTRTRSGRTTV